MSAVTRNRRLLFVSDLQAAFTRAHFLPLHFDVEEQIANVNALINLCREHEVRVVFSMIAFDEATLRNPPLWIQKIPALADLGVGSPLAQLDERLDFRPGDDVCMIKRFPSAFWETPLGTLVASEHVDEMMMAGVTTSGCVRATTLEAMQRQIKTLLVKDALNDFSLETHTQALDYLGTECGDITSVAELRASW